MLYNEQYFYVQITAYVILFMINLWFLQYILRKLIKSFTNFIENNLLLIQERIHNNCHFITRCIKLRHYIRKQAWTKFQRNLLYIARLIRKNEI